MTVEVDKELCGQCRVHSDCTDRYNNDDAQCLHRLKGSKPDNFCVVQCIQNVTIYDDELHHGSCEHDEDAGMDIWKCHHGYEGDCTTYTQSCEDRCLNGGEINCQDDQPCPCPQEFVGEFCEVPSPCHEGI